MVDLGETGKKLVRRDAAPVQAGFGIRSALTTIVRNRRLVLELARREMTDLHAGQLGGFAWLVAHPLLLFCVYAFLFTVVFRVRIGEAGPSDYLVYLMSGLAPWLLTQDVMVRSAHVMLANATIVKKVMFPTEVLVAKMLTASLLVQGVLFAAAVVYTMYVRHGIPVSFALLPAIIGMHLALLLGIAFLFGAITPYFRDMPELLRVFVTINIYMMPVMYIPTWVPHRLRFLLSLNPFSHVIWCYQDVLYFNRVQHPISWVVCAVFALVSLMAGCATFSRLRHHMASVL
jgi:lipopolysaccharide transport system permease protein